MPRLAYVRALVAVSAGMAAVLVTPPAQAAAPWIYRDIVLPRANVALDVGLGIGHEPTGPNTSITGTGLNLELAAGITHDFELGVRTGFRLDDAGERTRADAYRRPFDTETYGTGYDREANPELHFRWAVARAAGAELGLELRAYLPIEHNSNFGMMFGVPVRLRSAGIVRIDTGVYVPVIFSTPTRTVVSIPVHLWIQASSRVWLGPLFGFRVVSDNGTHDEYPLGFGLGTMLNRSIDMRTWFLFPDMGRSEAARSWGVGLALSFRFE
jgi:hypothetical protein